MSSGQSATLDPRPAEALPPNNPSCGNQPAYISLDHASSTDTRAPTGPTGPQKRRPNSQSGRRFTLPLDRSPYISAELLAETGKPLAAVVVSGRPLLLQRVDQAANAVLLAPLLGQEAGPVIAAALTGALNPSGKLPSTFPRHLGQIPLYHGHHHGSGYGHPSSTRHGYGDLAEQGPLYPFGHGLSYTTFTLAFDKTALAPVAVHDDGVITTRIRVTNTGTRDGQTVVQLYARDEHAAVVRPVRQLLQFARVALAAGESRVVELSAPLERLHYTLPDGSRGIEPGEITIMAAFSSDDIRCTVALQHESN